MIHFKIFPDCNQDTDDYDGINPENLTKGKTYGTSPLRPKNISISGIRRYGAMGLTMGLVGDEGIRGYKEGSGEGGSGDWERSGGSREMRDIRGIMRITGMWVLRRLGSQGGWGCMKSWGSSVQAGRTGHQGLGVRRIR